MGVLQNSYDAVVIWSSPRGQVRPAFRSVVASGCNDSTVVARWNVAACTAMAKVSLVRCWQRWDGATGQDDGAAVAGFWMVDLLRRTSPISRDAGGVGMGRQHCCHSMEQHSLHSSGRSELGGQGRTTVRSSRDLEWLICCGGRDQFRGTSMASGWDDSAVAALWNVAACAAVEEASSAGCWRRCDGMTGQDDETAVVECWVVD